ncbi:MAG: hypothetical protein Q9178_002196 [Gyalolechia marmorata]
MFTTWRSAFIGLSILSAGAAGGRPPHRETSALGFESFELEGPSQRPSPPSTTMALVEGIPPLLPKFTSSSTVAIAQKTSQSTFEPVAGNNAGPILQPSTEPSNLETIVSDNDISTTLGGPGAGLSLETPPKDLPVVAKGQPDQTVSELGPITAVPAPRLDSAPIETPRPLRSVAQETPTIPTDSKPFLVFTAGASATAADSSSQFVAGTQTLASGSPTITHSGVVLFLPSSRAEAPIGPSTQMVHSVMPPPEITISGTTVTANPVFQIQMGGQTPPPGATSARVNGQNASAQITRDGASQYIISGQNLAIGAPPITVSGQALSIPTSDNAVDSGSGTHISGNPLFVLSTSLPVLTVGDSAQAMTPQLISLTTGLPALTLDSTTLTVNAKGIYVLSGQTIQAGVHAATIDGHLVSLAFRYSYLIVGTSIFKWEGITKTDGTVSRSMTRITIPAESTAKVGITGGSAPTMDRSPSAEPSQESTGSSMQTAAYPVIPRSHQSPPSLFTASKSRLFSTSPARRKDPPPEDIPDPIPRKTDDKAESQEQQDEPTITAEEPVEAKRVPETPSSSSTASGSNSSAKGSSGSGTGGESGGGDGGRRGARKTSNERAIQKPTVPEIYPQVMAIPIAKRPLFPGFYKAVTIRDPNVAQAIQEMMRRGQQYVGAFLFKDEASDKDIIENMDEVHDVGVFAQITSAFPVNGEEHSLTAVLYPHRRIKMSRLIPPNEVKNSTTPNAPRAPPVVEVKPVEDQVSKDTATIEKSGDVVASFEESNTTPAIRDLQPYEPTAFLRDFSVSLVDVDNLVEEAYDKKDPVIKAVTSELVNVFKDVANLNHLFRDQISTFSMSQSAGNILEEPGKLADFAAAVSAGEIRELQDVLETMNVQERLSKALMVLKKELMNAQLQAKISKDVESKIQKRQREYWLMEQMKGIRRELGIESDGKDKMVEKFKEKASKLAMPEAVQKVFEEELNKLAHLEPAASEFNVTRNYLDWLTQIPWGQQSAENFGIKNAMTVLDEDHHGLKDVKDRILEFIAVGKLRGTVEGKILCFVGPPGVGKTSIGKSIARALNRQYYRFSVGGLTDVAEIKGHRRTYVGALPGRIVQALKKCQTENPLILIDEVDKIGRGHQGDPSSALLELLDPEQNNSFLDHYLDVPVDLSKVLFVCTANMTDTIPRPLLDRMEMIELSGYVADEKMAIAERYLAPAAKELSGLKDVAVNIDKAAIEELIKSYCRESGVRNLKKQIEKVYRKSALNIIRDVGEAEDTPLAESKALTEEGKKAQEESKKNNEETDVKTTPNDIEKETTPVPRIQLKVPDSVNITIDPSNLKDYVGPPVFTSDRLYETTPPGVAMGLAWTSMGGAALYVESILENALSYSSRPGLERTGNLKSVMKESTVIAYSFAKGLLARKFPDNKFFENAKVHLHCPEGAVQKDGPSAGVTMATSLLSLALGKGVGPTVAMTGELTVTGKVLRIGGLREKTVAARRAGAERIIFPMDNMSDWIELPEERKANVLAMMQNIKEGIEGHAVSWYSEIFDLVFSDLDHDAANHMWKKQLKEPKRKKKDKDEDSDGSDDDD